MQTREENQGDMLIVSLLGHLDTATAAPLEERLTALLESGTRRVVADCSGVDYINSAGLKTFLFLARRFDAKGGKLVLCGLRPNVSLIFETVGFDKIMTIVPTRADAVRRLNGEAAPA
jgi:stage II sporulation protein AA (anti-sigma F factor antagonist)